MISWRSQPGDAPRTAFVIERRDPKGAWSAVGRTTAGTCFWDASPVDGSEYRVRTADGSVFSVRQRADRARLPYLSIPLVPLDGYSANDGSIGDLDGDGEFEIVVHRTGRAKDNSQSGPTDPPILEAYRLDGRRLWRINLGVNIREGAHYTQFLVSDFDGDGKAEVACKTADGTVDGTGKVIGNGSAKFANDAGYILRGPEYLTVFRGTDGKALDTKKYLPGRHPETEDPTPDQLKAVWGDGYGNRVDRFLSGVAFLDGQRPSLIFSRGYYTRTVLAAWDFRGGKLSSRWVFDTDKPGNEKFAGQGNHGFSVADVDADGKDEIVYGSMTVDDDGTGLYSTGLGHGDALHVSDLDPTRPGLEVAAIHEHSRQQIGVTFRDARTGEILWKRDNPDVGRGVAFDVDPRYPGAESWASLVQGLEGMYSAAGKQITAKQPLSTNFGIWWDGDPLRELLDKNVVYKWDYKAERDQELFVADGATSNNGTKATPVLSADFLGDWREEFILKSADEQELRIYSTPIPTGIRQLPLMYDHQYQMAVIWQQAGYNQPPHPSFDMVTHLNTSRPTLWIIGDSTVRNGSGDGGNAQWGWGDLLAPHFDLDQIRLVNRAIGGRSSRTFRTEGRWEAILKEAKPGDFVLMQFGHNDAGAINDDSRARGTIRGIGEEVEEIDNLLTKKHEVVHSYGWYMRQYVREARERGLHPVICSYVPRCPQPGTAIDPKQTPSSYRQWAQQIAEEEKVPYIDLFRLIAEEYSHRKAEQLRSDYFTSADLTHTNRQGAMLNARMVVRGIPRNCELAQFLKTALPKSD